MGETMMLNIEPQALLGDIQTSYRRLFYETLKGVKETQLHYIGHITKLYSS